MNIFSPAGEGPRRTLLDSFLALKDGNDGGRVSHSASSQSAAMQLKNGQFTVEVDIQDFDLEDIDIKVEGDFMLLNGKREGRGGNFRQFAQKIPLPASIDVTQLGSELTSEGRILISAPQKTEESTAASTAVIEKMGLSKEGEVDMTAVAEHKKTQSAASFEIEGGSGSTESATESQKKAQASTTKRITEDGYEEEIYEEYEEECFTTSLASATIRRLFINFC